MVIQAGTTLDEGFDNRIHGVFLSISTVITVNTLWDVLVVVSKSLRRRSFVFRIFFSRIKSRLSVLGLLCILFLLCDFFGCFSFFDKRLDRRPNENMTRKLFEQVILYFTGWITIVYLHVLVSSFTVLTNSKQWTNLGNLIESQSSSTLESDSIHSFRRIHSKFNERASSILSHNKKQQQEEESTSKSSTIRLDRFVTSLAGNQLVGFLEIPWLELSVLPVISWIIIAGMLLHFPFVFQSFLDSSDTYFLFSGWIILFILLITRKFFLRIGNNEKHFNNQIALTFIQTIILINSLLLLFVCIRGVKVNGLNWTLVAISPLLLIFCYIIPEICCDLPFCVAYRGDLPSSLLIALSKQKQK